MAAEAARAARVVVDSPMGAAVAEVAFRAAEVDAEAAEAAGVDPTAGAGAAGRTRLSSGIVPGVPPIRSELSYSLRPKTRR